MFVCARLLAQIGPGKYKSQLSKRERLCTHIGVSFSSAEAAAAEAASAARAVPRETTELTGQKQRFSKSLSEKAAAALNRHRVGDRSKVRAVQKAL